MRDIKQQEQISENIYIYMHSNLEGASLLMRSIYILILLPYFSYFEKIKVGLWDHVSVCVYVCVSPFRC
jgi:hypothetical protein